MGINTEILVAVRGVESTPPPPHRRQAFSLRHPLGVNSVYILSIRRPVSSALITDIGMRHLGIWQSANDFLLLSPLTQAHRKNEPPPATVRE